MITIIYIKVTIKDKKITKLFFFVN